MRKPVKRNYPRSGRIVTGTSIGGGASSIPIWRLIVGKPIFPSGVEGVRKTTDVNTEGLDLPLIEDLNEPILPDHVGVAINLSNFNNENAQRRLLWLGEEAPLLHDLWLGANFVAFSSIQILVTKDDPEDDNEFQSFLLPAWVS